MIWCVAFDDNESKTVKGVTVTVDGGDTLDNSKKAEKLARDIAVEVMELPKDISVSYTIPVYHDYFDGSADV